MLEMIQLSPLNMSLIFAVTIAAALSAVWGWKHSSHTRKLVKFAVLSLLILIGSAMLWRALTPKFPV